MPPDNATLAAAYRVLLCHTNDMATQRNLARAACVCAAWCDEAHTDAHNATMQFDVGGPHVARALRRCAAVVQELHVPQLLSGLPDGVCFPRLTLVNEYGPNDAVDIAARAPIVLAALRVAPHLRRWLLRGTADAVLAARSHALREGIAAEHAACRRLHLLSCIPAVAYAVRGLLPPARHDVDVHACVTARSMPGAGALLLTLC